MRLLHYFLFGIVAYAQNNSNYHWNPNHADNSGFSKSRLSSDGYGYTNVSGGSRMRERSLEGTMKMPMTITNSLPRTRRSSSDSPFHSTASKMALVARVLTGISLQNGLIDGSIPGDEAIVEMLSIGSVKLAELETFDKTKVDTFLANLTQAAQSMNNNSHGLETDILDMSRMKEEWMAITEARLRNLPEDSALSRMDTLSSTDMSALQSTNIVEPLIANLRNIPTLAISDASNALGNLKSSLAPLKSAIAAITTVKSRLNLQDLKNLLTQLRPIIRFHKLLTLLKHTQFFALGGVQVPDTKPFKTNLEHLKGLGTEQKALETLGAVVSSRFKFPATSKKYTSGFIDGYKDLERLNMISIRDAEYVKNMLYTRLPFEDGLLPLQQFFGPMTTLDSFISSLATRDAYKSIQKVTRVHNTAKNLYGILNNAESISRTLNKCRNPGLTTGLLKSSEEISTKLTELDQVVDAFDQISKLLLNSRQRAHIHDIEKLVELGSNARSEDLKKLKDFKGEQQLIDLLQDLKPHLKVLQKAPSLSDAVQKVQSKTAIISEIKARNHTDPFYVFFNCLKEVSQLSELATAVQLSRDVREMETSSDPFEVTSTALVELAEHIRIVKKIPTAIRETSNSASSKALKVLKNIRSDVKMFGEAVEGVIAIQKVLEKKQFFNDLIDSEDFLHDFGDTRRTVQRLLEDIRAKTETPDSTPFDTFCEGLSGLVNVDLKVEEKLKALSQASTEITDSLRGISLLDLQFTRYQDSLQSMGDTLKSIKQQFFDAGKVDSGNGGSQASDGSTSTEPATVTVTKAFESFQSATSSIEGGLQWWGYCAIFIPCTILIAIAGYAIWLRFIYMPKEASQYEKQKKSLEQTYEGRLVQLETQLETERNKSYHSKSPSVGKSPVRSRSSNEMMKTQRE